MPGLREEITKTFLRLSRLGGSQSSSPRDQETIAKRGPRVRGEFGLYRIVRPLGAGGMGEVYLALDTRLDRQIALKFLPSAVASNPSALRRLQQEARTASALNHPNILTIYEIGELNGEFFIASEYIDGITLRAALHRGSIDLKMALDVATQVASALRAAHSAGVIHRDLKPANIMIRPDGYVKVIDFGLAKLTHQVENETLIQETCTRPGSVIGTLDYMSPEQLRGEKLDARTDLWSLGVVLYEMVAQKRPFGGETESHVVVGILDSPIPPIESSQGIPQPVIDIVSRALTKNRSKRYQTAEEMLIDLQRIREPSSLPGIPRRTVRRKAVRIPPVALVAGLIVIVVLSWSVWWWGFHGRELVLGPNWFRFESAKRITFDGNVELATISPDGRYVAYVSGGAG